MVSFYFFVWVEYVYKCLFDFGCGDGWFFESCKSKWLDVVGFECDFVYVWNLVFEFGVLVYSDFGDLLCEEYVCFDIVIMNFVVEYVIDLYVIFDFVVYLFKFGGLFYFLVLVYDVLEYKIFGKNWYSFDVLWYISFLGLIVIVFLVG